MYNAPTMLKILRKKGVQKRIYIGLAGIVTVSFVVSGILIGGKDDKTSSVLARFEKRKISVHEYLDSYRAVQKQAGYMYGDKLDEMRSRINFKGEAWDRILLLDYAKKEHIRVSDQEVVAWITKQESFRKNGKFDDEYYNMYVARALRSTPRQFEEEIRQMLTLGKIQEKIKENLGLTDEKLKKMYNEEKGTKDLLYAIVPKESFENTVEVTDADIKQLYDLVKDKLSTPEKGTLSMEEAKETLKKLFRDQKAGELALKQLKDLKAKMKAPADFESVLTEAKIEIAPFENYRKGIYPPGIGPSQGLENAADQLGQDQISEAFEISKGAMIIKATKVHPLDEKKFEEEKNTFKNWAVDKESQEELQKLLEKLRDKLTLNLELLKEIFPAEEK